MGLENWMLRSMVLMQIAQVMDPRVMFLILVS